MEPLILVRVPPTLIRQVRVSEELVLSDILFNQLVKPSSSSFIPSWVSLTRRADITFHWLEHKCSSSPLVPVSLYEMTSLSCLLSLSPSPLYICSYKPFSFLFSVSRSQSNCITCNVKMSSLTYKFLPCWSALEQIPKPHLTSLTSHLKVFSLTQCVPRLLLYILVFLAGFYKLIIMYIAIFLEYS